MNVAICEDNAADLESICGYIKNYCARNCFLIDICTYNSGNALLNAFSSKKFDIIFMDIIMDGMSGIDTARKIRETDPSGILIFITTSKDYSLDAYSVDGTAYVVKPLDEKKMIRVLDKCRQEFMKSSRYITVPVGRQEETRLSFAGIRYVEVYNKEVLFHADSKVIRTRRMTLDDVFLALGGEPFLRCHRSYIVNMNYVDKLHNGVFLMKNGDSVMVRKNGYSQVQFAYSDFISKRYFWGDST